MTRLGFSSSTMALRILATASGSAPASVLTKMPRSAPMASAVRMVSPACCGPIETQTISVALPCSLSRIASSTAISSKGFIDILTLASSTPEPSALTRTFTLKSTTRFTGTRSFMNFRSAWDRKRPEIDGSARRRTLKAAAQKCQLSAARPGFRRLAVLPRHPQHVARAPVVAVTAGHEHEVGQPVDVLAQRRRDALAGPIGELHDQPFGAPGDGTREVQMGGGGLAAGQHERAQGPKLRVEAVDLALEPLGLGIDDGEPLAARALALAGRREIGAEIEQVVLDARQHRVDFRIAARVETDEPDHGVELVDRAVGGDPQIVFRAPLAAAERGGAVVAGSRVDAVEHDHGVLSSAAQRPYGHHDDQDGDRLQQHAQAHQPLRLVRRAALHRVPQTEQQHDRDRAERDRHHEMRQQVGHACLLAPARRAGHRRAPQLPRSSRRRAITCAWISAAPSKMERIRASHSTRETGYSSAKPLPPWICTALSAAAQATRAASSFAMPASRSQRRPESFCRAA